MEKNQPLRYLFVILFCVAVIIAVVLKNIEFSVPAQVSDVNEASPSATMMTTPSAIPARTPIFVPQQSTSPIIERTERVETQESSKETVREVQVTHSPEPSQTPAPTPTPEENLVCVLNVCL